MVIFGGNFTQRSFTWTDWKVLAASKHAQVQYETDDGLYRVWFYDGPEVYVTSMWTGTVPDSVVATGYSQAQNDVDKADFVANYQPTANGQIVPRTTDGRPQFRPTPASPGLIFRIRGFYFVTSTPSSLHNVDALGNAYGDVTMTCFDGSGTDVTSGDLTTAVRTLVDYEPHFNQDMMGGWLVVDPSLDGGTTDAWWLSAMGAPDIPANMGGCIDFVSQVNLEMTGNKTIAMDPQDAQVMYYDPVYHSGKIRFTFLHPAGGAKRFQIFMQHYS